MFLERGKRAAQPVGFFRAKPGADNGDLHRLFLKQGHAEGFAEHLTQLIRGEAHLFLAIAAPYERMHHVALNGPRPDDRHLDHQIIKTAWPHPGQKIHLGAAFDLKHPDTVGLAQHIVHRRIFGGQGGQRVVNLMMLADQIEGLADAGQHAKRQNIDLEDAKTVDIVLVPADNRAVFHGGVFNGDQLVEPPFGHDETADMLGKVTRETLNFLYQVKGLPETPVARVKADFAQAAFFDAAR